MIYCNLIEELEKIDREHGAFASSVEELDSALQVFANKALDVAREQIQRELAAGKYETASQLSLRCKLISDFLRSIPE